VVWHARLGPAARLRSRTHRRFASFPRLVGSHALGPADSKWLYNKLDLTAKLLGQATGTSAVNQLEEVRHRLDNTGPGTAALVHAVERLIQSLTS